MPSNRNLLVALTLLLVSSFVHAQQIRGFSSRDLGRQLTVEKRLQDLPTPKGFEAHLRALTQEPHVAGSPANDRVADYMAEAMAKAGMTVEKHPYDIYLPQGPGDIKIELVTPIRLPLNNKEYVLPEDPFSNHPDLDPGWNAFSGSGDATGEVVYANYGRKEDFEQLAEMGISVKGKIVLARYGGNFRGYKAKFAAAAGAAGLVIYTDPADNGYMKGLEYPEGPYFNESTIQRGSVLTLDYTGDPLTPFEPALPLDGDKKVDRLDPKDVAFHTIPVTPIPYGSAKEIFSRMKGKPVPAGWQGGLPYTYRLEGGAALTLRVKVDQPKEITRIHNVVGTLEGSQYPNEWIVLGCHYDAWSFGATDPNSGTAMLLNLADALGELVKAGYRPKRTIKIAHWDAEEFGILGSTEWVEEFREELSKKAIAYFNADGACTGLTFGGSASPSLKPLMIEATKAVQHPKENRSIYEHWLARSQTPEKGPNIGNLGGGSDHLPFYAHVGIPSLGAGMRGKSLYHSGYDNFHWYKTFSDPDFLSGPTTAKVFGVMALRLANANVIPLDIAQYGIDLEKHLTTAEKAIQKYNKGYSLESLKEQARAIAARATRYEEHLERKLDRAAREKMNWQPLNAAIIQLERCFIDPKGMAYGKWYQSLYASSDPYSGYASWMLPGLLYEASLESTASLPEWEQRYSAALQALEKQIGEVIRWTKR